MQSIVQKNCEESWLVMLDLREEAQAHLPQLNLSLEHYPLKDMAIKTWKGRMVNEHGSAMVFDGLYKQCLDFGLEKSDLERLRSFADEERQHGVLCGAVVEALGGEARADVLEQSEFPIHQDASPLEGVLRNLLSISCLSETVAVSLIAAEREELPEGELKELLTKIWAEECGHANFGWRLLKDLLPQGDPELPQRLGEYLCHAFGHLEAHELAHLPLESNPPPAGSALGLCSGREARALFYATVEGIIVPSLESHGIPAKLAWEDRCYLEE